MDSASTNKPAPPSHAAIAAAESIITRLIAVPRMSRAEADGVALLEHELAALALPFERVGRNLLVTIKGQRPAASTRTLMLCSHVDTVPPATGYTIEPFRAAVTDDRIYGLGSNDAGASVAAMMLAAKALNDDRATWSGTLKLALVVEEEVNGAEGAERLLREAGQPDAAIVGEPTALNICTAQKGLVVLDCVNRGQACHAANAWRLPHQNAILAAIRDIEALGHISFTARDEALGPTTLNVTIIRAGAVHNSIPDKCEWTLDCRVNPAQSLEEVAQTVAKALKAEVKPRSLRLHSIRTPESATIVQAAQTARPSATLFGSDTMSDAVFFKGVPVIKCGPGRTELSHQPDEYVERHWIPEGIAFYERAARAYFHLASGATA